MKHLKTYQLFEARTELTKEQEAFLDRYTEGTWTYNPATGLVDVKGDFDCSYEKLKDLKEVRFGKVNGRFYCRNNELTSLEGAPQEVSGDFKCDAFELEREEWNPKGWLRVLEEGSPEAQKLILILLPAEELNKEIAKDPAGMIMKLKDIWNDDGFRETRAKLVWPKGYEEEADLVGDLDDVGF